MKCSLLSILLHAMIVLTHGNGGNVLNKSLLEFLNIKFGLVFYSKQTNDSLKTLKTFSKSGCAMRIESNLSKLRRVDGQESVVIDASTYDNAELRNLVSVDQLGVRTPSLLIYEMEGEVKSQFIPFKVNQQVYSYASNSGTILEQYEINGITIQRKIAQMEGRHYGTGWNLLKEIILTSNCSFRLNLVLSPTKCFQLLDQEV